ncbi:MAG: DMT family transporter [Burkholderiales bacterium]
MTPQQKSLPRAVAWMCAALAAFLLMAIAGRELSGIAGPAQLVVYRSLGGLLVLLVLLPVLGWRHARTKLPGRHVLRGAIHFAAQYAWFYAIARIPLAAVFALEFTTPIWAALIAALFFRERLDAVRIAAILLGFVGVLVVLQPGAAVIDAAAIAALLSAVGYAMTYAFTKNLVATDSALTILLWMNLAQFPLSLAVAAPVWGEVPFELWGWVVAIAVTGLVSHYSLARALTYGDMTVVVPIDFLRLPLAAGVAWLMYGEAVGVAVFAGGALIFCGVWLNLRRG